MTEFFIMAFILAVALFGLVKSYDKELKQKRENTRRLYNRIEEAELLKKGVQHMFVMCHMGMLETFEMEAGGFGMKVYFEEVHI